MTQDNDDEQWTVTSAFPEEERETKVIPIPEGQSMVHYGPLDYLVRKEEFMYSAYEGLEARVGDCTNHMGRETVPNSDSRVDKTPIKQVCPCRRYIVWAWSGIADQCRLIAGGRSRLFRYFGHYTWGASFREQNHVESREHWQGVCDHTSKALASSNGGLVRNIGLWTSGLLMEI